MVAWGPVFFLTLILLEFFAFFSDSHKTLFVLIGFDMGAI